MALPPGAGDDPTIRINPPAAPTKPVQEVAKPTGRSEFGRYIGIAAGLGLFVALAGGGWFLFGARPGTLPAAPGAVVVAPPVASRFAVRTAGEAEILTHVATSLTVFRFAPNPRILVLDFPDLRQQGLMLNRAAALIEKKGLPRDRVLSDRELDEAIAAKGDTIETYYYGHDYASNDLVRFFRLADAVGMKLRPEEEELRALLQQEGALTQGANMSIISIPRAGSGEGVDMGLRTGILRHELSHGEFFTNPIYVAYSRRFWAEGLDETFRDAFRRYLLSQDYDIGLDDLLINEMQAYLMHTTDPRLFSAQVLGVSPDKFAQMQANFLLNMPAGWLRDCTPGPAITASGSTSKPRRRRKGRRVAV